MVLLYHYIFLYPIIKKNKLKSNLTFDELFSDNDEIDEKIKEKFKKIIIALALQVRSSLIK